MNKKEIPIAVLKAIEQFDNKKDPLYQRINGNRDYLVKFIDSDIHSDFFFQITKYDYEQGALRFFLKYKPGSEDSTDIGAISTGGPKIEGHFDTWANRLRHYSKNNTPFDQDPILEQYQSEFFAEYELLDEDADIASYNTHQQLLIDSFLEQVNEILEGSKTERNVEQVEELKNEIDDLRNNQSRLTKQLVFKKIGEIASKVRKHSIPVFKKFIEIASKELVSWGIKQLLSGV